MKSLLPWSLVGVLAIALLTAVGGSFFSPSLKATAMGQKQSPSVYEQGWAIYELPELEKKRKSTNRPWMSFLQVPTLYCGVYSLAAGAKDGQSPHREDEVYYVVKGKAKFEVGTGDDQKTLNVRPGTVLYVKADVAHRFLDIQEDLEVLVFFSTAKPSSRP